MVFIFNKTVYGFIFPTKMVIQYIVLLLAISTSINAALVNVTLVKVIDGDTVKIQMPNVVKPINIRMRYIDAPEKSQKYGMEATAYLKDVIGSPGQALQLDVYKTDMYGRIIGVVYSDGLNMNKVMVDNGYAWCYRNKCPEEYKVGVDLSKEEKLGLFKDPNPVTPWDYRKSKKKPKKPAPELTTEQIVDSIPIIPSLTSNALRAEVKLISVADGDTITVRTVDTNDIAKIRFLFIDAPEKSQEGGMASKNYLKSLLEGSKKKLVIRMKETDRYGRILGVVMLGRRDVNKMMVAKGLAWCYKTGCPRAYKGLMLKAAQDREGIWKDNPQAPWVYRRNRRNRSRRG